MDGIPMGYFMTQEQIDNLINEAVAKTADKFEQMLGNIQNNQDRLYTLEEYAKMRGVCLTTIRNWDRDGIIKIEKKGRRAYVRE